MPERKSICREIHARFGYSDRQRQLLRRLCRYTNDTVPEFGRFYLLHSDGLTRRLIAEGVDWSYLKGKNDAAIVLMEMNLWESAMLYYSEFVVCLMDQYWPECDHPDWKATQSRVYTRRQQVASELAHASEQ